MGLSRRIAILLATLAVVAPEARAQDIFVHPLLMTLEHIRRRRALPRTIDLEAAMSDALGQLSDQIAQGAPA